MKFIFTLFLSLGIGVSFGFYSVKGTTILDNNNNPTQIKSLAISLFENGQLVNLTPTDFSYIRSLKFNSVDFSMVLSEIDKDKNLIPDPVVLKWLKKNTALAKQANLGVIFSLKDKTLKRTIVVVFHFGMT